MNRAIAAQEFAYGQLPIHNLYFLEKILSIHIYVKSGTGLHMNADLSEQRRPREIPDRKTPCL